MVSFLTNCLFFFLDIFGLVFIYAGLFLREDEERKFQNKVEEWWIKLSDKQKTSRSRVASFMQGVAKLTGNGFDRLFGQRLFSLRIVPVSIYLSLASVFLMVLLFTPRIKYPQGTTRQGVFFLLVYFVILGLVPALFKNRWVLAFWWAIIPVVVLSWCGFLFFVFRTRGARSLFSGIGLVTLIFASSLLCDLIYITITRYVLSRISRIDRIPEILIMVFLNLLALVIPLLAPVLAGIKLMRYFPMAGAMLSVSVLLNSIDFLAGFAAFFLAIFLLLHRLFWPVVERPLYAICRFNPIKEKKWLFSTGVALLILSHNFTMEVLKAILHRF